MNNETLFQNSEELDYIFKSFFPLINKINFSRSTAAEETDQNYTFIGTALGLAVYKKNLYMVHCILLILKELKKKNDYINENFNLNILQFINEYLNLKSMVKELETGNIENYCPILSALYSVHDEESYISENQEGTDSFKIFKEILNFLPEKENTIINGCCLLDYAISDQNLTIVTYLLDREKFPGLYLYHINNEGLRPFVYAITEWNDIQSDFEEDEEDEEDLGFQEERIDNLDKIIKLLLGRGINPDPNVQFQGLHTDQVIIDNYVSSLEEYNQNNIDVALENSLKK